MARRWTSVEEEKVILSKTMRLADFTQLQPELSMVDHVLAMLNGGDKAQHPMRRWEYAMALKAYDTWRGDRKGPFKVSDHGACTGMLGPMMLYLGNEVTLYEVWAWGNQEEYMRRQMEMVTLPSLPAVWKVVNRPLGGLTEDDKGFDVGFCISTIEHIPDYEKAFRELCQSVRAGGMIFLTSDSAKDEQDHYIANHVRCGTMFNKDVYERMAHWGESEGFQLMGGEMDYSWDESCQLIPAPNTPDGYGFACLSMERK